MNGYAARLLRALDFAAQMHRDQRRKGADSSPYINHPIEVASLLAGVGGVEDEDTLVAAILHDTIEDTTATREQLESLFGADVARLVLEMTDDKSLQSDRRKTLQVEQASRLSHRAKLIKIADKTCNVRDVGSKPPPDWSAERRLAYFEWAEKVVGGCRGVNPALEACFDDSVRDGRARLAQEPDRRRTG
jgi:guanosine-3',5'-bis(diphosphate) 3'-pyrophosphohydrolase